jgi:ABC-type Fe3+ transport system permease subunit
MKTIKSVNITSFVLYGAVLAAFWTFAFGLYYWILGWIFGAQSWWIDMNLANWTAYSVATFMTVIWRSLINALGGALAGLLIALVYNAVAGMMGGIKLNLD